jgi:membrane protease YdiL (CAAX protease family)
MGQLCILFRYLASVGLVTCLIIACALPFVVAAVWQTRARNWQMLWLVGVLLLVQTAVISLPPVEGLGHLHWHWQECLLSIAWPLLPARFVPTVSLNSIGVTSRLRPGWLTPSIIALLIAMAVPAVFFVLGSRSKLTTEGWLYLSTMPGLAEELVFRGVFQSLLNRAGAQRELPGAAEARPSLRIPSSSGPAQGGIEAVRPVPSQRPRMAATSSTWSPR